MDEKRLDKIDEKYRSPFDDSAIRPTTPKEVLLARALGDAVKDVRDLIAAVRERGEPVAWLRCGSASDGEIEDWEIDANNKVCERINDEHDGDGAKLSLYLAPPTVADALERAEKVCQNVRLRHLSAAAFTDVASVKAHHNAQASGAATCESAIAKLREEL